MLAVGALQAHPVKCAEWARLASIPTRLEHTEHRANGPVFPIDDGAEVPCLACRNSQHSSLTDNRNFGSIFPSCHALFTYSRRPRS